MSEEKRIMEFLGRTEIDGEVRGSHLGKVLTYLKTKKTESWDITISKLALVLGMNSRYIRENYLKGIMYFGIIELYRIKNNIHWQWIGEKVFNGETAIPTEPEQVLKELDNLETKEGFCPSCGKKLPEGKRYCNEKCLREHIKKRNSE